MENFVLRKARPADAAELARVKRLAWESSYRGIYPDEKLDNYDYELQSARFSALSRSTEAELYAAEFEGQIIGYMCVEKKRREALGENHEISLLYLLKAYHGLGLGRRLFEAGRALIADKGAESFIIACNKYNLPAQGFYSAMGGAVFAVDEDTADRSVPQKYFYFRIDKQGGPV